MAHELEESLVEEMREAYASIPVRSDADIIRFIILTAQSLKRHDIEGDVAMAYSDALHIAAHCLLYMQGAL